MPGLSTKNYTAGCMIVIGTTRVHNGSTLLVNGGPVCQSRVYAIVNGGDLCEMVRVYEPLSKPGCFSAVLGVILGRIQSPSRPHTCTTHTHIRHTRYQSHTPSKTLYTHASRSDIYSRASVHGVHLHRYIHDI